MRISKRCLLSKAQGRHDHTAAAAEDIARAGTLAALPFGRECTACGCSRQPSCRARCLGRTLRKLCLDNQGAEILPSVVPWLVCGRPQVELGNLRAVACNRCESASLDARLGRDRADRAAAWRALPRCRISTFSRVREKATLRYRRYKAATPPHVVLYTHSIG